MYGVSKCIFTKSLNILDRRAAQVLLSHYEFNKIRFFCDDKKDENSVIPNNQKDSNSNANDFLQPGLESKYSIFQDADAPILLDVYEEKMQLDNDSLPEKIETEEFYGLNLDRGVRGVFDIEDLVELLRRDKAEDIFVAELPPEARYVDHIVIVSGRSRRHMIALAEIVRKLYKKKRLSGDLIPRLEGEGSSLWMAMDLGNIALHIFSREARQTYDLESLWSVGTEYDSLSNVAEDPLIDLLKRHSISLNDVSSKGQLL